MYPYGKGGNYVKINSMKEHVQIPPSHYSYLEHRRQFWLQIFLPMILAVIVIVALAVISGIAAFGVNGDPARWAAISTIWLVVPVMIFGLLFFAVLGGLVYLLARGLQVLPTYTSNTQYYIQRVTGQIKRSSDMATRPVFFIEGIMARIKAIFGRN